jgi:hypothetical protein
MVERPKLIEVYEVRDDPQLSISDAVAAEIRHGVKSLEPTPADPAQGTAIYKQILPGIMQMPADWLIAWGGSHRSGRLRSGWIAAPSR